MAEGVPRARAVVTACRKTIIPRFLAMLCVLAVFIPSFFMAGVARQLFIPLSLAVGFSMLSSYVLSSTLVPVLSTWLVKSHGNEEEGVFGKLRSVYTRYLTFVLKIRWPLAIAYAAGAGLLIYVLLPRMGTEIFPSTQSRQLQVRMRAPTGTRMERTEVMELKAMDVIKEYVGPDDVDITSAFIGTASSNYPINTIYLFSSGQHESILGVALKPTSPPVTEDMREALRQRLSKALPTCTFSFEPADIISQVLSFGSATPIEVAVQSPNLADDRTFAEKVRVELAKLPSLRDLRYAQPLEYPSLEVIVDRDRAGQFGLSMADIGKSMVAATSSSRYTDLNFWRDPRSGNGFQIQVEIPQSRVASIEDVRDLPVMTKDAFQNGATRPLVADLAKVEYGTVPGEVDRYNMQRVVSLTANIHGKPLGQVLADVKAAIQRAGTPPRGVSVVNRGQVPAFEETSAGLRSGLLLSVVVIFLLLAANFQSIRLSIAVMSTVPAVICGVLLMLLLTGTTLNIESFMGAIMAIGISVANAILLVSFAEHARMDGASPRDAAVEGARGRIRAILMTASAMTAGMIPMAVASGERALAAPLGRAVIGGLVMATFATLTVLPSVYAIMQGRVRTTSASLDPDDPTSRYYEHE
jgi:multidrug efflux pump subunit AcrB